MTENKKKNLIVASTAIAIIVFFALVIILAYQTVAIIVKNNRKAELESEIARLTQEIENAEDDVELWQEKWKIEERARQLGYVGKKDDENDD